MSVAETQTPNNWADAKIGRMLERAKATVTDTHLDCAHTAIYMARLPSHSELSNMGIWAGYDEFSDMVVSNHTAAAACESQNRVITN